MDCWCPTGDLQLVMHETTSFTDAMLRPNTHIELSTKIFDSGAIRYYARDGMYVHLVEVAKTFRKIAAPGEDRYGGGLQRSPITDDNTPMGRTFSMVYCRMTDVRGRPRFFLHQGEFRHLMVVKTTWIRLENAFRSPPSSASSSPDLPDKPDDNPGGRGGRGGRGGGRGRGSVGGGSPRVKTGLAKKGGGRGSAGRGSTRVKA